MHIYTIVEHIQFPYFFIINGYFLLNKKEISYSYVWVKIKRIVTSVVIWNTIIWILKRDIHKSLLKNIVGSFIQRGYFFQFWFFGALVIIYLTLPLLQQYLNTSRKYIQVLALLIFIGVILEITNYISGTVIQSNIIQTFRLWTWYFYYIVGGYIGKLDIEQIKSKLDTYLFKWGLAIIVIISPIIMYGITHYIHHNVYAEYLYDSILVKVISISIFLLFLVLHVCQKLDKFLLYLASLIMGVFITHTYVINLLNKIIDTKTNFTTLIVLLLTIVISFSITAIIDKIPYLNKTIKL